MAQARKKAATSTTAPPPQEGVEGMVREGILALMRYYDWNLEELARRTGMHPASVRAKLTAKSQRVRISFADFEAFAHALGIPTTELLGGRRGVLKWALATDPEPPEGERAGGTVSVIKGEKRRSRVGGANSSWSSTPTQRLRALLQCRSAAA